MEWIKIYDRDVYVSANETSKMEEYVLVWNGFILIRMTINGGKIYMISQSPEKYNDREFSFMRKFLGKEDIEQVKLDIIDIFKGAQ